MRKLALPIALVFGFAMIGCSDDDDNCVDVDGDGYGDGSDCLGADCDDSDDTVWMDMDGYGDVDDDGESSDTAITLCTDGTLPAEYSATAGTDCDDTNADAVEMVAAWVDADDDGFGEATEGTACGDSGTGWLPPGFVDNGDDCDDASAMLFTAHTGYLDWDEDTVATDVESTICGTAMRPANLMTDAGTDCDDIDPYATNDASHAALCAIAGTCIDTELAVGFPDGNGIGACATVDCDGANPACGDDEAPMTDTMNTCVDVNDCNAGELCWDATGGTNLTCWSIPACCQNNPAGLYCSEVIDCLSDCGDLLPDTAAYAQCQQFSCFEQAMPQAQHLYRIAAECAAAAGCWGEQPGGADAIQACVESNCLMDFAPCLVHAAP